MANITLTGCFNKTTGKVDFDLDTPCGVDVTKMFYGCLETTAGANFGKIKVVTTGNADSSCDGTYYGCFDTATGKFSVDVPEECCTEYIAGDDCSYCNVGETPKYLMVSLSGKSACIGCNVSTPKDIAYSGDTASGNFIVTQNPTYPCIWEAEYPGVNTFKASLFDKYTSCGTLFSEIIYSTLQITVSLNGTNVTVQIVGKSVDDDLINFGSVGAVRSSGCVNMASVDFNTCPGSSSGGGSASVAELWP